jgi:hypothetical protein
MVAATRSPGRSPIRHGVTGYDRGPALADDYQALVGQNRQGVQTHAAAPARHG